MGEARHREVQGELGGSYTVAPQIVALIQDVRIGDLLFRCLDGDRRVVVLHEMGELLHQVAPEMRGMRHGGCIDAGSLELGEGARDAGLDATPTIFDPKFRIAKAFPFLGRWGLAGVEIAVKAAAETAGGIAVKDGQPLNCGFRREVRHHDSMPIARRTKLL